MLELSDAFRASAANLIKLADAQKDDPDLKATENENLQGEEEALWRKLNTIEMDLREGNQQKASTWGPRHGNSVPYRMEYASETAMPESFGWF